MGSIKYLRHCILCLLIVISCTTVVYPRTVEERTIQAVLTLNIARYTSWPESVVNNSESVLNLCVIGNNTVQLSFLSVHDKTVDEKNLNVINLSRLRNLSKCQILYISNLKRNVLIQVLKELKGQSILTVSENASFLKAGGMIALETIGGKIQLKINLPIVKQSGLVISSRLLKLAEIVDSPYP